MSAPAISIITIVKNNEELLSRAIDSVLSQSFSDYEYIIVNDGSTDSTKEIINTYATKQSQIKTNHLTKCQGRAAARNRGLLQAKGHYIFFLDSDDYLPQDGLKNLYHSAESNDADIVFGRTKSFDQATGEWLHRYYTDNLITEERHRFQLEDHLNLVDNHQIVGTLYRSEFLRTNKILFSEKRKNAEDVIFAFHSLFKAKNISTIPSKLTYYYSVGKQLQAVTESKIFNARDNVFETVDFASKNGSRALQRRMIQKGAIFSGNLQRAQRLYENDDQKLKAYIHSLIPLVTEITDADLKHLPLDYFNLPKDEFIRINLYFTGYIKALRSEDIDCAYLLWRQKNDFESTRNEIHHLQMEKESLKKDLEKLYNSSSWKVTAPLRYVKSKIIGN